MILISKEKKLWFFVFLYSLKYSVTNKTHLYKNLRRKKKHDILKSHWRFIRTVGYVWIRLSFERTLFPNFLSIKGNFFVSSRMFKESYGSGLSSRKVVCGQLPRLFRPCMEPCTCIACSEVGHLLPGLQPLS